MKNILINILISLFSIIGILLIIEFFLIKIDYSQPHLSRYDYEVGVRHMESSQGFYIKESKKKISINKQGIRVPNDNKDFLYSKQKPANVFRISVYGDSFTEGLQVSFHERFTHIMETELNKCKFKPKSNIEIINFGLSGTGQARQFLIQQGWTKEFETDMVLNIAYMNDVRNNVKRLEMNNHLPYWKLSGNSVIQDNSFRELASFQKKIKYSNLRMKIVNNFRFLQFLTQGYEIYKKKASQKDHQALREKWKKNIPENGSIYDGDDWIYGWNVFLNGLKYWNNVLENDGKKLFLASAYFNSNSIPKKYSEKLKISQINFDQLMEIESKKNGYFYFPVSEYMKNREKELGEDFDKHEYSDTGHYNNIGHREWGLILSKRICNHWKTSRSQTLTK